MDDATRRTLDDILAAARPANLVDQFKSLLLEVEVTIKSGHRGKYFLAQREGRSIFILAHESSSQGFWGVLRTHVSELEKTTADHGLTGWGAVLLDASAKRGFWIKGSVSIDCVGKVSSNILRVTANIFSWTKSFDEFLIARVTSSASSVFLKAVVC